jgi:hypothetical protein
MSIIAVPRIIESSDACLRQFGTTLDPCRDDRSVQFGRSASIAGRGHVAFEGLVGNSPIRSFLRCLRLCFVAISHSNI